jgi:hypothetical protein
MTFPWEDGVMGKTLGEMSPDERRAVIKRAAILLQRELEDNAEAIASALDAFED